MNFQWCRVGKEYLFESEQINGFSLLQSFKKVVGFVKHKEKIIYNLGFLTYNQKDALVKYSKLQKYKCYEVSVSDLFTIINSNLPNAVNKTDSGIFTDDYGDDEEYED